MPRAALLLALLAACADARVLAVPIDLDGATRARAEAAAAARLGDPSSAVFDGLTGHALADGTVLVCGAMRGRDSFGIDWGFAPVAVRLRGAEVLRVHVDDSTGYGPATIACTHAAEGLAHG